MNNIINTQAKMSSKDIADLLDKRHDSVKRTIFRLSQHDLDQPPVIQLPPMVRVKNHLGQFVEEYIFTGEIGKRDSIIVVAQLSPEFTAKLVDRWWELEKEQGLSSLPNFNDPVESARAWADAMEEKQKYELAYQEAKPAIDFVDKYVDKSNLVTFRQACKLLNEKENHVSGYLLDNGIMYRLNGKLTPYSQHLDTGRFVVKTGVSSTNGAAYVATMFTPKGLKWLAGELAKSRIQMVI